jgi:hypothetical protein
MSQVLARGSRHTLVPLQAHMCPDNHIVPTFCELIVKSNICRELKKTLHGNNHQALSGTNTRIIELERRSPSIIKQG